MKFLKNFWSPTSLLIAVLIVLGLLFGTIEFAAHSYATTNSNLPALEQQQRQLEQLDNQTKQLDQHLDKSKQEKEFLYGELKPVRAAVARGYSPVVGFTIIQESKRWGLNSELVMGIIDVEAGPQWTNHGPNWASATGLMQIEYVNGTASILANELGLTNYDLMDPVTNIKLGTYYIAKLKRAYGDVHTALTAYNRGTGGLQEYVAMTGTSRSGYSVEVLRRQVRYENMD